MKRENRFKLNVMHLISVIDNPRKRQQFHTFCSSFIPRTPLSWRAIDDGNVSLLHLWRYFNVIQGIQKSMLFSLQPPNNRFIYLRPSCHNEIFSIGLFLCSSNEIRIFLCSCFFFSVSLFRCFSLPRLLENPYCITLTLWSSSIRCGQCKPINQSQTVI